MQGTEALDQLRNRHCRAYTIGFTHSKISLSCLTEKTITKHMIDKHANSAYKV